MEIIEREAQLAWLGDSAGDANAEALKTALCARSEGANFTSALAEGRFVLRMHQRLSSVRWQNGIKQV